MSQDKYVWLSKTCFRKPGVLFPLGFQSCSSCEHVLSLEEIGVLGY